MKTFKIPVTWKVYGVVEIRAETLKEAIKIFDEVEDVNRFMKYLQTRVISKESIEKMRVSLTGRKLSSEHIQKLIDRFKKEIVILTLDGDFVTECNSVKEVAKFLNLRQTSGITTTLTHKQKSCKGHQLLYKEEYNPENPSQVVRTYNIKS